MRRADRLFQILQHLRRRRVTTAARLAEELEVSERTIYRDIQDLVRSGVPIEGEAGVGYALPRGFDLPPLMFTRDELEAVVLGARIVRAWGDAELAKSAADALARIEAAVPDELRRAMERTALFAPDFHVPEAARQGLPLLRRAIETRHKVRLEYERGDGERTHRLVRPLGLFFWGHSWSLTAWCELREAFRHFRLDRIHAIDSTDVPFADEPGRTLEDFLAGPHD